VRKTQQLLQRTEPQQAKTRFSVVKIATVLLLGIIGLSSLAYLATLTNTEVNVFGIGKNTVDINERFNGWQAKEVRLTMGTADDDVPSVVRAMIVPYVVDGAGNYIPCDLADFSAPANNKMELGDVILELASDWSDNWIYGDDGYFYYRYVLYPEAGSNQTSLLLSKVSLTSEGQEKYDDDAEIKIEVLADILQAEGTSGQEWGITIDVSAGTVTKP